MNNTIKEYHKIIRRYFGDHVKLMVVSGFVIAAAFCCMKFLTKADSLTIWVVCGSLCFLCSIAFAPIIVYRLRVQMEFLSNESLERKVLIDQFLVDKWNQTVDRFSQPTGLYKYKLIDKDGETYRFMSKNADLVMNQALFAGQRIVIQYLPKTHFLMEVRFSTQEDDKDLLRMRRKTFEYYIASGTRA